MFERIDASTVLLTYPLPWSDGPPPVNLYLLEGDRPALFDTGPNDEGILAQIEADLGALGVSIARLADVVVTHHHIDHAGLAGRIAERSGARLHLHPADIPIVSDTPEHRRELATEMAGLLGFWGVPGNVVGLVGDRYGRFLDYAPRLPESAWTPLAPGRTLSLAGRRFEVIHCPGHAAGLCVFWEPERRLLFANDHILPDITPNPSYYIPAFQGRRTGLADYLESLERVRELPARLVLPGHGLPFEGLARRVSEIRAEYDERRATILARLAQGPATILDLVGEVWKGEELTPTHYFLACREIHGHLDIVEGEGFVGHVESEGVGRFELAAGASTTTSTSTITSTSPSTSARTSVRREGTMAEAYILEAVRTPIGKRDGGLAGIRSDELAALCLGELVRRAKIDPGEVEDVVMGCVTQMGEQGINVARNAALIAGFPVTVCGTSVNRLCGSSQQAVHFAAQSVLSGATDLVIGAGVENMSRVAMGSDAGPFSGRLLDRFDIVHQGISAEFVAERWGLSREELDRFGLESHQKAVEAIDRGHFQREIFAVRTNGREVATDEGPRRETSLEKMATLKPAFRENGRITAGNSSQISDAAAALMIGSSGAARRLGLAPRARFVAFAVSGVDPTIMLTGPIPATKKVLEKAGLSIGDIDLFEVNEAFAPVVIAWARETGADLAKTNVNGGAIALGHPLGATGARLLTTILHELERRKARYGLVTMCIGFGQGTATIIERLGT